MKAWEISWNHQCCLVLSTKQDWMPTFLRVLWNYWVFYQTFFIHCYWSLVYHNIFCYWYSALLYVFLIPELMLFSHRTWLVWTVVFFFTSIIEIIIWKLPLSLSDFKICLTIWLRADCSNEVITFADAAVKETTARLWDFIKPTGTCLVTTSKLFLAALYLCLCSVAGDNLYLTCIVALCVPLPSKAVPLIFSLCNFLLQ